ncbi:hypothetical protein HanPSC8_Chr13g0547251 [Helianthus annuus]|nr:hypothetical protein HanPSC8_Chr13g0547251 [Helianthus annuus]
MFGLTCLIKKVVLTDLKPIFFCVVFRILSGFLTLSLKPQHLVKGNSPMPLSQRSIDIIIA